MTMDGVRLENLTEYELQGICQVLHIGPRGTKAELIARVVDAKRRGLSALRSGGVRHGLTDSPN